jgi:predicted Zn finger-like uncharacterized protein
MDFNDRARQYQHDLITPKLMQVTRCPHCASLFNVYEHELTKAQGWVRCGSCHLVFLATQHSFQSEPEFDKPITATNQALQPLPDIDLNLPQIFDSAIDTQLKQKPLTETEHDVLVKIVPGSDKPLLKEKLHKSNRLISYYLVKILSYILPRIILFSLLLTLIAQVVYIFRYEIIRMYPWVYDQELPYTHYTLRHFCKTYECHLKPIRSIKDIKVKLQPYIQTYPPQDDAYNQAEATALIQIKGDLHNMGALDVITPDFQLIIRDSLNQTITRKILSANDLNITDNTLTTEKAIPYSVDFYLTPKNHQEISTVEIQPFYR